MSELKTTSEPPTTAAADGERADTPIKKLAWETPKLEDVSEQVMAQPYIRFT